MSLEQMIHLVIAVLLLLVPFCLCYLLRRHSRDAQAFLTLVGLSAFIMSGVVMAHWAGFNWVLESKIAALDRNGDGIWSQQETDTWTEEDHRNMDAYIVDGGRNGFVFIMFPIVAFIYSLLIVSLYWVFAWWVQKRR